MSNLIFIIGYLYPDAEYGVDWVVRSHGGVETIELWNTQVMGPEKTIAELLEYETEWQNWVNANGLERRKGEKKIDNEIILRALVGVLIDELNILRAAHGLSPRTLSQARTAIKNKVDSGDVDA